VVNSYEKIPSSPVSDGNCPDCVHRLHPDNYTGRRQPGPVTTVSVMTTSGYTDLTPAQAKDLIATEKELIIIDVSPYYANGHLPGAISIPLDTLDGKIPTLDKTKTYLVYCHGDAPSISGAQKLVDAGFMKVYRLAGNYAAWVSAGYPVST